MKGTKVRLLINAGYQSPESLDIVLRQEEGQSLALYRCGLDKVTENVLEAIVQWNRPWTGSPEPIIRFLFAYNHSGRCTAFVGAIIPASVP